ncbi:MAG: arsenate reductase ArsC [Candidatus Bathyarchaeia archaeon]
MKSGKRRVLFICVHNSARSQMAEGFLRHLYGDRFEAYSAGVAPSRVNPYAVKAMAEVGIDISSYRSKSLREFLGGKVDVAVTVCDEAKEACPFFPGASKQLHWGFPDPSEAKGSEEEVLEIFRRVRDAIKEALTRAVEKGELGDS